jgi:GDP-D-mannose dehydratase
MRVLITGITGFVGSHLAEFALGQGTQVFGSSRWRSKTENIDHLRGRIELIECDLRDLSSVHHLLETSNPDLVFHLAAQSFVQASWHAPAETMNTNIISQVNLLEALRARRSTARFLVVGSSEEYGFAREEELPIREGNPLRPLSPYGVSKVAQDLMGYQYFMSYRLPIVRTRAFNHSVSRRTPVLLRDDGTGLVDVRYISELRRYRPTGSRSGRLLEDGTVVWDMRRDGTSVWADGEWTKIVHLSCHPLRTDQRIVRVVSGGGIVEATGDHSVMVPGSPGPIARSAEQLSVGDRVALVGFPCDSSMVAHEDVAWFLGFFAAAGAITGGRVRVDHQDRKPLECCAEILLQHFGMDSACTEGEWGWRLTLRPAHGFAGWLRSQVYAGDGSSRVPRTILNAQTGAKLAFLQGYTEGDRSQADLASCELESFRTESPVLALGLCYLIAGTTRQRLCLDTEVRPTGTGYVITLASSAEADPTGSRSLQIPDDVVRKIEDVPYAGEVWDFETENHVFHAGVGRNLVHNTGPRRGEVFVSSNFARQIAEIEESHREPVIQVGNLTARRDYSDVRDVIRGYWRLLQEGEPGEVYNLASGRAWAIREILDFLLGESRVRPIAVKEDPARLRPSDVPVLIGDAEKARKAVGWAPEIPFEQTLRDLLGYWRQRVAGGRS